MQNETKEANVADAPEACKSCGCYVQHDDAVMCLNTCGCPYDVIDNDHWL